MSDDKKAFVRHTVTLDRRESISVTGVSDVISFDEETVVAETEMGVLIIRGLNLHVSRLNLENGELEVDGDISSLNYEDDGPGKGRASFLGRLFK